MHAPESTIGWPDVLRVVQDEPTRSRALGFFREAGFKADAFRTNRKARETVLEGLVRAEDALEGVRGEGNAAARTALRVVRRRLEVELWP